MTKLLTPKGRISYPHLFEPDTFGDKPEWNVQLLIPKDDTTKPKGSDKTLLDLMGDAIEETVKAKWGKKPKNFKSPVKDGDSEAFEDRPETDGCWVISFGSRYKINPPVMANPKIEATPSDIKAGDYGRCQYKPVAYDVDNGKSRGVKFILENFQWLEEGEALGSVADDPDDAFNDDMSSNEVPEPETSGGASKFL